MGVITSEKVMGGGFLVAPAGTLPQFTPEELNDDSKAIGEAARDFVEGELLPNDARIDSPDFDLSVDLLKKAGELGLLSIEIPEAYEGMDLDKKTALCVLEEMGKQASFSVSYGACTGIGTLPIVYFGNDAQKANYLPRLASGELLAAYALTEAGAGSDAMNAKTTAVLDGDIWVLNGSKMWITNAGFADVFVVFAKVDGRKFSAFIVEKTDPGFSLGAEEHKLGIKGSSTRALAFDNCRIPKDRLLGEVGRGHRIAFGILAIGRFKLGAACTGTGKVVLKNALTYTAERQQFGKPIHSFGLIQKLLADIATRIFVNESLNFRTIAYVDEGMKAVSWEEPGAAKAKLAVMDEFEMEASMSKIWGSEALFLTADDAVQCYGGYGFSAEYPPEKIYRDSRINRIFEGTNEINRLIVAGQILKRVGNGSLAITAESVQAALATPPKAADFTGPLAPAKLAVELSKRICWLVTLQAHETVGPKLLENQEAAGRLSDIAMEIYAMESALVRADKMTAAAHRWAPLAQDVASAYVNEAWNRVTSNARLLLAELCEGADLDQALARLRTFDTFAPLRQAALRSRIAGVLIEKGEYPIQNW